MKVSEKQFNAGPLIIESLWANTRVLTGALVALHDPNVVRTEIWESGWVPEDII